jgi:hypothetical protein
MSLNDFPKKYYFSKTVQEVRALPHPELGADALHAYHSQHKRLPTESRHGCVKPEALFNPVPNSA